MRDQADFREPGRQRYGRPQGGPGGEGPELELLRFFESHARGKGSSLNKLILLLLRDEQYAGRLLEIVESVKRTGNRICYVCLSKPYADVVESLKEKGIDTAPFLFIDALSSHYRKQEPRSDCIFLDSPSDLQGIRSALETAIEKHNCSVLLFDTFSSLLIYQESFQVLKFAHSLTSEKGMNVAKIFIVLKSGPAPEGSEAFLNDLKMFADKTVEI
jgi:hypothetical protein